MKPALFICLSALLLAGCSSFHHAGRVMPPDPEALITVEYKYEESTETMIWQVLGVKRVSNWTARKNGLTETIEAQYDRLPAMLAAEIQDKLSRMPEVIRVEVKIDEVPPTAIRRNP
jgi:hypothetical protein